MSAPWRTVAQEAGNVEDEGRGADDGPLLSLLTKSTAPPEARSEPVEPTPSGRVARWWWESRRSGVGAMAAPDLGTQPPRGGGPRGCCRMAFGP